MFTLLSAARSPIQATLNLFLQGTCPLCDRTTPAAFCPTCTTSLQQQISPQLDRQSSLPVLAWGRYEGLLKRAIAALKYQQQAQIGTVLGQWLGEAWHQHGQIFSQRPVVVPIPLHPDKLKQRGYNQAELIAQGFCRVTGWPLAARGLQRTRATEAQFGLDAQARQRNVAEAFELGHAWQQRSRTSVLLIDDIYTTGATALSAANTLRRHQVSVLGIAAIARAGSQIRTKPHRPGQKRVQDQVR